MLLLLLVAVGQRSLRWRWQNFSRRGDSSHSFPISAKLVKWIWPGALRSRQNPNASAKPSPAPRPPAPDQMGQVSGGWVGGLCASCRSHFFFQYVCVGYGDNGRRQQPTKKTTQSAGVPESRTFRDIIFMTGPGDCIARITRQLHGVVHRRLGGLARTGYT